ncbi:hypothetical protein EIN_018210 [Entamoeba invadens IP1]|uniref:hypothetical protein n=1 Tax=Entamoeba invadens IP1 TaxID=370355 RepID=UPI0002C3D291|nr:hypothetical protein EIN_018210 [Entamoeba invadens IP1]ELP90472.1 hypothetical protein EIN_018210 [Entamoeba invadens IP1]|eukprot:XP_004257243.1 hypothetical protein EIN_018210 [Entamoeba invadens IP1]
MATEEKKERIIDYFFLVHGLSTSEVNVKEHWQYFVAPLRDLLGTNYIIKYCKANAARGCTSDGLQVGALRLANEICLDLKDTHDKRGDEKYRFHFIGHSVGGLYIRLALPILLRRGIFNNPNYTLFNYISIEAPHAGIKKPENNGAFDTLFSSITGALYEGQTLNDLNLADRPYPPYDPTDLNEQPLLVQMVLDNSLDCLKRFAHLTLIQNIKFSMACPYVTGALDRAIPYDREFLKDKYLLDAYGYTKEYLDVLDNCTREYKLQSDRGEVFEEKVDGCVVIDNIINKMNELPWRRLNVNFRTKSTDLHYFLIGLLSRKKIFKQWGCEDVDTYLYTLARVIKRDIDIVQGSSILPFHPSQSQPESDKKSEKTSDTGKGDTQLLFDVPSSQPQKPLKQETVPIPETLNTINLL